MTEGRILIIDDEPMTRDVLAAILQDEGFGVAVASTAAEGLQCAANGNFDVALVDIMLPDGDGMEVVETLQDMEERPETLVITGYPALETAVQAVGAGAFDYLSKPLETERVLISVYNALSVRRLALRNRQSLHDLQRANTVLRAINEVFRGALHFETQKELASACLERALWLTGSECGFIGELTQPGGLRILAASGNGREAWVKPSVAEPMETQSAGLWGLSRSVLGEGTAMLVNGIGDGPCPPDDQPPLTSFLGVPLRHQGKVFGVIALANKAAGYDLADQEAIDSLSVVLGEALSRKRAEELARRQSARAQSLASVAARLNAQLDLDEVLNAVCEEAVQALGVPAASVSLYSEGRDVLYHGVASHNLPREFRDRMKPTPRAVYEQRVRDMGSVIAIPDVQELTDFPNRDAYAALGIRTIVSTSMLHKGQHVGTLDVFTFGQVGQFSADELATMRGFADLAAQAIANARLFEQVRNGREELRSLAGYLESAREEQRTRIAREIHDLLGQRLSALKWDLAWMAKRLSSDDDRLMERMSSMSKSIESTIHEMRRIGLELRPQLLDHLGLVAAIEWQAQEFSERTGIECALSLPDDERVLERDLATAIFRILQETLTNVAGHAEATSVQVELRDGPDGLFLTVRDNGRGITESQIADPKSLGLIGMRERARAKGGDITFRGSPGQGTTVSVHILRADEAERQT